MIKSLFVHIPKNGGISILDSLDRSGKYKIPDWQRSCHFTHSRMSARAKFYNYTPEIEFCVVRNPYDRFVSIYHHVQERVKESPYYTASPDDDIKILGNAPFDKFVRKTLCEFNSAKLLNNYHHFMLQSAYLDNGEIETFRFEDFSILEKRLGIKLKPCNVGKYDRNKSYYTNEKTKKIIEDFYERDFEMFGY